MFPSPLALRVTESSQVGEVRRFGARVAEKARLNADDKGRLSVVITEAAYNLAKHARDGEMLIRAVTGPWQGVEVLAIDWGPGMRSPAECLRDGYSTAGTPGTGLGAIRRMSDVFDLYSQPERGTVLLARVQARGSKSSNSVVVGGISVPLRGEEVCGDQWAFRESGRTVVLMIADGLGHGETANQAAREAVTVFESSPEGRTGMEIIADMHTALRATRGAAVGITHIDLNAREVRYSAIGNIGGAVLSQDRTRMMIYHNGTVGHERFRPYPDLKYPFPKGATLIMHSDGLATWNLDKYPGVLARHPAVLAGVLYRDFRRGRDDVTVVVARETQD